MATIKEVAEKAGVSVGTVSNVLNEKPVKHLTKERVLAAMKDLSYSPNSIARMLKTRISKTIGLVVPDISNPFYSQLARGAEDEALKHGNTLFLCNKDRNSKKEEDYLHALISKGVDGIILVKPSINHKRVNEISKKCSLVLIDANYNQGENYSVLNVDDKDGALIMMEYLFRLGHRNIHYFMGSEDSKSDFERYSGYRSFMEAHGLFSEDKIIHCGVYNIEQGYSCASRIFSRGIIPDAIFASNDILAIGAVQAAFNHGIEVPNDISIAGCDDIIFSRYMRPTLTTLNRPKYRLGSVGVKILVGCEKNMKKNASMLCSELVIRDSCAKAT